MIEAIIQHYERRVAEYEVRIAELEAELFGLRKTPQNSSLRPSTQHPHAKPVKPKSKSNRKRGGQPGHARHERPLIPTEECDAVVPLKPTEYRWCGTKLSGTDAEPLRHPVYELPEIKLVVERLGRELMRPAQALFRHWSRCRDGTLTRRGFERLMQPIRQEIDRLLRRGAFNGNPRLTGTCRELVEHRDWLRTFLDAEGIEPTNNAAERAVRRAVIRRKLSFGMPGVAGSRFVETLLPILETCRQQQRNLFEFVTQAVEAHFHHRNSPPRRPGVNGYLGDRSQGVGDTIGRRGLLEVSEPTPWIQDIRRDSVVVRTTIPTSSS